MRSTPLFLTIERVLHIHWHEINQYGGSHGIRSPELLESALHQPIASFGGQFLCKDLFEMAAAYLFHLVQNHPFDDGNKRVGAACAYVFLRLNGWQITASEEEFEKLIFSTASGKTQKPEIAEFFRKNSRAS